MAERKEIRGEYFDRPEMNEIFADSLGPFVFDGQTLRIEFLVTRMGPSPSPESPTVRAYPVCRLVLTPKAATDLMGRMRGLAAQMQKDGAAAPPEKKNQERNTS